MNKRKIITDIRNWYDANIEDCPAHRSCVQWAVATVVGLQQNGITGLLQAGSASFQFRKDPGGDAITHYSYMHETTFIQDLKFVSIENKLPELHAWGAVRACDNPKRTDMMIDLTTGLQPIAAAEIGIQFEPEMTPPTLVFGTPPKRIIYRPTADATMLVLQLLKHDMISSIKESGRQDVLRWLDVIKKGRKEYANNSSRVR